MSGATSARVCTSLLGMAAVCAVCVTADAHTLIVHHSRQVQRYEMQPTCVNGYCQMVRVPVQATVSHWGSGVVIGRNPRDESQWLALTAAHVVDGTSNVQVQTGPGVKWRQAVVIARRRDNQVDVALLAFAGGDLNPRGLAQRDPSQGEQVVTWGAGANQVARTRRGYVESVTGSELRTQNTPVEDGESGGPVIDLGGKIVGVVSGYRAVNGQRMHAVSTTVSALRQFVVASVGVIPGEQAEQLPDVPVADLPAVPDVNADWQSVKSQAIRNRAMILAMQSESGKIAGLLEQQTQAIEALSARLDAIELRQPERGERGPAGPQGPVGTPADVSDIERRLSALESRPIVVDTIDPSGKRQRESFAAGEPLEFRLHESDISGLQSRMSGIEAQLKRLQDIETPVRVYWGSQDKASVGKTRILRGEPIELNFDRPSRDSQ